MRTRPASLALVVALASLASLLGAACGGGKSPGLSPPTDLAFLQGGTFDAVIVTWTEPAGPVDGYELEGRLEQGPWEPLTDELVPAGVYGLEAQLEPTTPELLLLGLRIRSARGAARSPWSPEVTLLRGVRPPASLAASPAIRPPDLRVPPVHLTFANASQVATALVVTRAPTGAPNPGPFVEVARLAPTATTYDDQGVVEGAWIYRLVAAGTRAGAEVTSGFVEAWGVPIDVVPPRGLTAVQVAGGVRLAWTNGSPVALQAVTRLEADGWSTSLGTLPVGTSTYLDPVQAPWPAVRYEVAAVLPSAAAAGPLAALPSVTVVGPVPLTGTARLVPGADLVALADDGRIHAVNFDYVLQRDAGDGWEAHPLDARQYATPAVLADEAGNPHTVVYRGYADQPDTALVHVWWDGAAWQEETVTLAPADGARVALGPGGALHALVGRREPAGTYTPVHHLLQGGLHESTDLAIDTPPGEPAILLSTTLAVARDGTAWIAATTSQPPSAEVTYHLLRRTAAGAWSETLAPVVGSISQGTVLAGSASVAALLFDRFGAGDVTARLVRLTERGWGEEETVAAPFPGVDLLSLAMAPDGERVSLLFQRYPDGLWLSTRTASGWETTLVGTPAAGWASVAGYRADGRATVVVSHGFAHSSPAGTWVSAFVEAR